MTRAKLGEQVGAHQVRHLEVDDHHVGWIGQQLLERTCRDMLVRRIDPVEPEERGQGRGWATSSSTTRTRRPIRDTAPMR
jgi:hypothetical protein